jgi:hypothetical protein
VTGLRDYAEWHRGYDDPASGLSWRLRTVRDHIRRELDARPGPVRVLSACAGDGRDILGVLSERADAARVGATLIELHPDIAARAREAAAGLPARVEVRERDAGHSDAYSGAAPADLVLLVGIFGNIGDADLARTIAAAPQLCAPGALLLWSRGRHEGDANASIRARFAAAGFTELDYATREAGGRPALGAVRYSGPATPLVAGERLFTFVR